MAKGTQEITFSKQLLSFSIGHIRFFNRIDHGVQTIYDFIRNIPVIPCVGLCRGMIKVLLV